MDCGREAVEDSCERFALADTGLRALRAR